MESNHQQRSSFNLGLGELLGIIVITLAIGFGSGFGVFKITEKNDRLANGVLKESQTQQFDTVPQGNFAPDSSSVPSGASEQALQLDQAVADCLDKRTGGPSSGSFEISEEDFKACESAE